MQLKNTSDHIINWLKAYDLKAKTKGFVIGISGGIDSALTSTLAAQTGAEVLCLSMPIHQDPIELERSKELCDSFSKRFSNVTVLRVPLTEVYEATKAALPDSVDLSQGLALANTRARLRMTFLYAIGAQRRALVVGTGNKIEDFGIGFFTKYGDGGVDVSPIADLLKSEVYALGRVLGVPQSILEAAPTDGLWGDGRNDEDQIGASYAELEIAMRFSEENGDLNTLDGREKEVYEIYTRLNTANRHKMDPIPVCTIPRD